MSASQAHADCRSCKEERQLLDRLSNINGVQYNPGNICTPGTRLGILRDVETWASNFLPPLVASLRGKAGIGKSTVAHTVALNFFNMRRLAASYFFSRDVAMSRPLKNLLPELSRQLAFRIPSFRHALCAALESDDFPVFPQQQLSKLLIEPLRASLKLDDTITRPWIIVLDALDECEDDIRNCILLLTEAVSEFQGKLKLIVTSRPEAAIDAVQRLRQTHVLNIDLASAENESDLRIYFELGLRSLRAQPGWPTIDPIRKLVMLAGGLFVWAAIVVEFLLESDALSEEIELILNGTRWEDNPEKRLAQMYHIILEKAYLSGKREVHFRLFLPVLATVMVVSEPQSDIVIGHLAADGMRYEHLCRILEGLSAVLHIPPDSPVVRATHPSFYRYLTDDCKDDRFAVHSATHSRRLGQRCLTIILQKVHRDMCGIMGHAGVPQTHIVDFRHRVSEYISQEVQYACKNWILHITAHPDTSIDPHTIELLSEFFQSQLLPWIEVMALLDSIYAARESLTSLNLWLKVSSSYKYYLHHTDSFRLFPRNPTWLIKSWWNRLLMH
jgi:NACHT domain